MENFFHYWFLNKCYFCDSAGEMICNSCLKCFIPSTIHQTKYFSLFEYNDIAKKALYLSKYPPFYFALLKYLTIYGLKNRTKNYNFFYDSPNSTILCPVPLSSMRLYERKFNQSEIIAKAIEIELKLPFFNLLKRVKDTLPLFDLDKNQRRKELKDAFKPNFLFHLIKIFNISRVIIIDDLLTTGQTYLFCSRIFKSYGIEKVDLFTLFSKK